MLGHCGRCADGGPGDGQGRAILWRRLLAQHTGRSNRGGREREEQRLCRGVDVLKCCRAWGLILYRIADMCMFAICRLKYCTINMSMSCFVFKLIWHLNWFCLIFLIFILPKLKHNSVNFICLLMQDSPHHWYLKAPSQDIPLRIAYQCCPPSNCRRLRFSVTAK